ncbi:C4-dicarboxylate ABC transporter [Tamilnaduibacter salinus]|uniref:C4-dicarboxylate ABC transporter n=1 Tax=Tamilnaduibacter salinus TaxID=1484056 RepID=A0A2A2I246_9GAMM|nr:TRAP transporter large permease subunit [Tamilnaduibacter salinus]PAV25717.1 C4-dicarboxylate ABC transporter [Tamilnaduibacter salinus]
MHQPGRMTAALSMAGSGGRRARQLATVLPVLGVLLASLLASLGETLHSRLLEVGEANWPNYFELRLAERVQKPACDPRPDMARMVDEAMARQSSGDAGTFGDVFGDGPDRASVRASVEKQVANCRASWETYRTVQSRNTWPVQLFAAIEVGLSQAVVLVTNNRRTMLCLLLLLCAATATFRRQHIALRPVLSTRDDRVATVAQALANGLLTVSAWLYREQELAQAAAGMPLAHLYLHDLWVAGFGGLTAISVCQLIRSPVGAPAGGHWTRSLLCIPLYSIMCLTASAQFAAYGFYHGIAVYLNMMAELSSLFLNLGLYVWVGMLLGRSRLPHRVFDLVRPLELPPRLLGVLVLALTALPTAYTGASGIFILAAGMTLYQEMRRAGTSEPMALAITAISGSMGTMLRPCLLVVIVATLNSAVTTDELFGAGARVLILTLTVFAVVVTWLGGREPIRIAPARRCLPAMARALGRLLPYVAIFAAVMLLWEWGLGRGLDEFSAPAMLPVIMLLILGYERLAGVGDDGVKPAPVRHQMVSATDEATTLIGALLMLMALSVSMGGLIERSGVLELFPMGGSIWVSIALLMGCLVVIGMVMDPYGAVLLVNSTLAPLAITQGIDPLHFWTMTILAFEMGYLTPPVALNHLLTRQVVGMPTSWESLHGTFWQRHFRIIVPVIVMGITLAIVTFTPLLHDGWHGWLFQRAAVAG